MGNYTLTNRTLATSPSLRFTTMCPRQNRILTSIKKPSRNREGFDFLIQDLIISIEGIWQSVACHLHSP